MTWFDAQNETAELGGFGLIPPGRYVGHITAVQMKNDKWDNEYINIEITFDNRKKYYDNVYLSHPQFSDMAEKGRARLKQYCLCAGIEKLGGPADLRKLVGQSYVIEIGKYVKKDTGEERNAINAIEQLVEENLVEDDVPLEEVPAPAPTPAPVAARPVAKAIPRPLATPVRR